MKRILGLDVGDKKIGVAVSDPLDITAQGLATFQRKNFKSDCETILAYCQQYEVQTLLVGLPLNTVGEEGRQAKKVRFFAESLQKVLQEKGFNIPFVFWDESGTSNEAEAILLEADLSRKKRKKVIDTLAAAIILQSYLDNR